MKNWPEVAQSAIRDHRAQQQAPELAVFLTMVHAANAQSVLEVGSAEGGLTWALMNINSIQKLVCVDMFITPYFRYMQRSWGARIQTARGDSTNQDTVELVRAVYDVVIIDGGHDWFTASSDWNNYARMCRPGGIVMIHDTQGWYGSRGFDVPELWAQLREKLPGVELVSRPKQEAGTGIIWAGEGDWWKVLG